MLATIGTGFTTGLRDSSSRLGVRSTWRRESSSWSTPPICDINSALMDGYLSRERTIGRWRWRKWPHCMRHSRKGTRHRFRPRMNLPDSTPRDYSAVTEFPRSKAGRMQVQVISRRYRIAKEFAEGKRVLEVGCGSGFGLGALATVAKTLVAGDLTTSVLRRAQETYRAKSELRLVQFDAQRLPFRDGSFDLVVAMAMVYYLNLGLFLEESRRV